MMNKVETKFNEQVNIEDIHPKIISVMKYNDERSHNIHIKAISKKD